IRWGNAAQYNVVYFNFNISSRDLSHLAENGFALEFMARTLSPLQFDVRFVNAESVTTIPWRMRYMVNESIIKPDGQWHTIRIPLSEMSEHGAWVNETWEWLPPRGEFDWKSVNQLDFLSEYSDLTGKTIWFDEIKIVKP
ncbi:MAG: hypothetical protein FWD40_06105, partial [Treponema sp.]|nr:hypothetical protein [Treponema sp.]